MPIIGSDGYRSLIVVCNDLLGREICYWESSVRCRMAVWSSSRWLQEGEQITVLTVCSGIFANKRFSRSNIAQ